MFILILFTDFEHERIGYSGIFKTKKDILKAVPILSYADLTARPKKYRTVKSLFRCVEVPRDKKRFFNTFHLTKVDS